MIGSYGQCGQCSSIGAYGIPKDPERGEAMAKTFDAKYGTDVASQFKPKGVSAGGVLDFIGNIVGAAGDIVAGVTGVKAAKENAAATIEATRNQLASSAIAYKSAAHNARLAPVLQAQQLQVKQAQTRALLSGILVLGGGALILGLILSTRKRGKKKKK